MKVDIPILDGPPTEEGWYYVSFHGRDDEVEILEIYRPTSEDLLVDTGDVQWEVEEYARAYRARFAGPIPNPFNTEAQVASFDQTVCQEFWDSWPAGKRRVQKKQCFAKIKKLVQSGDVSPGELLDSVEAWKKTEDWCKDGGAYIPMPMTWLNQQRWEYQGGDEARPTTVSTQAGDLF